MIKYIFSDMDGTLLDENSQLPEEFGEILAKLKERGVTFVASSGRQYWSLLKSFDKYKEDMLFIAENGSYVADAHKEIYSASVPVAVVKEILDHCAELPMKLYPVLCGKKKVYLPEGETKLIEAVEIYNPNYQVFTDIYNVDDEILKISIADFDGGDSYHNCCRQFADFKDRVDITLSSEVWTDFMPLNGNKGTAIKSLQKMFGVKPEECAAFGDFINDLEMLDSVYYSYAMENAHDEVKKKARFRAKSNVEHGVLLAIQDMMDRGLL